MLEQRETRIINGVTLALMQGNIVEVEADAIVNAANSALAGGGGVDGAIHRAGGPQIMAECRKIGGCPTGSAVVTTAGRLRAKYVFHAVGPIYGVDREAPRLLASAYQRCLDLAEQYGLQSIAFPSLSTGAYGYPLDEAAPIALRTIITHVLKPTSLKRVMLVLYGEEAYRAYARALASLLPAQR
ncbi:O-acetyl-ADP-ribose deacetylase [Thermogemmatispora onikobensis]|uniref:O-acetyl-ADP-ribose deacetylase n=1 Tax=Thermogemmatispora onikobensis TaxID=732234 RepID=UPI00085337FB|nr:O-acetyl-ADP-ribose deacetylase [Thermogemmatispora onikobensis]